MQSNESFKTSYLLKLTVVVQATRVSFQLPRPIYIELPK